MDYRKTEKIGKRGWKYLPRGREYNGDGAALVEGARFTEIAVAS